MTPPGLPPPVFYPSYQLSAVRIRTESWAVIVEHQGIEKSSPGTEELTLPERLLSLGRTPDLALPPLAGIPAADTGWGHRGRAIGPFHLPSRVELTSSRSTRSPRR